MQKEIAIIGAALGWGARWPETELGPAAIKTSEILKSLNMIEVSAELSACLGERRNYSERLQFIYDFCFKLANQLEKVIKENKQPIIIGGDHAIAMGTWQGIKSGLGCQRFGLLWIDAHLDAHTPETSLSHNIHGMPLAVLLGFGESILTNLKSNRPTLLPKDVALIGIRSADPGETELIQSLGVRVFTMSEINERGLSVVMQEAQAIITRDTEAFGVSIDVDAFDPIFAPGTGSPEPNGLIPEKIIPFLKDLLKNPLFCGLEIAEFNPIKDHNNITLNLVSSLMKMLLN